MAGLVLLVVTLIIGSAWPDRAGAQDVGTENASAQQALAERHVPVLMLKAQDDECDPDGEPYEPISVEAVLDNPQVVLRQVGTGNPVMVQGPTAADLYDLGEGFYLDFPGDALAPGCVYERDNDRFTSELPPTVYAHVIEDLEGDQLVVQYWFYWYYNDWNNKHESDWEGIALLFDVPTAAEALETDPVRVGYSQHEGAEGADWDADKLEREGDRPVVYPSAGSHASYYGSALYLGRSGAEGFGCDNTDGPSRRVDPEVVVLPTTLDDPDDPLAWIAYDGRWGERQSGPFNGPTGPAAKDRWTDPLPWFDELRSDSVTVPAGDRTGDSVVGAFCSVVEAGSDLLIAFKASPTTTIVGLLIIGGLVAFLANRTVWNLVTPLPVRARRRFGQIVRASVRLYGRRPVRFAVVGIVYLPMLVVTGIVVAVLSSIPLLGPLLEVGGDRGGTGVLLALFVGSLPNIISYVVVNAVVFELLRRMESGATLDLTEAFARVWARRQHLVGGFVRSFLIVSLLLISVVGIPWGVRQLIRYQFMAQVVMGEDLDGAAALRRSSELVRGRWWHTALAVGLLQTLLVVSGVVVGLLLLVLFSALPLWGFSVLVGLTSAALVPLGAIGMTLLYGDAVAEADPDADGLSDSDQASLVTTG